MPDETAKDNRQTAALISHDMTRNKELAFASTGNLQFYCFKIMKLASSKIKQDKSKHIRCMTKEMPKLGGSHYMDLTKPRGMNPVYW